MSGTLLAMLTSKLFLNNQYLYGFPLKFKSSLLGISNPCWVMYAISCKASLLQMLGTSQVSITSRDPWRSWVPRLCTWIQHWFWIVSSNLLEVAIFKARSSLRLVRRWKGATSFLWVNRFQFCLDSTFWIFRGFIKLINSSIFLYFPFCS